MNMPLKFLESTDIEADRTPKSIPTDLRPGPLHIGKICIDPPLILAPMAGVTDPPYRRIMEEHGAGLLTTEMISIEGLRRNHPSSWKLFSPDPDSSVPLAVQLFGSDPEAMVEAAKQMEQKGAPLIDINAGCPVRKVVRQGAGAGLLRESDRLVLMVEQVRRAVGIPVTVKLRLGWDSGSIHVVDLARRLSAAGADALTLHARTAVQLYSGQADWSWIRKVKAAVNIPVIGNGDIVAPSLADRMLEETGCDAVMIGRATMGNPWLLSAIASKWGYTPVRNRCPDWNDFYTLVHEHLTAFQNERSRSAGHVRKILIWYSKGCPEASPLRSRLIKTDQTKVMLDLFYDWVQKTMARGIPFLSVKVPETANQPGGWEAGRSGGASSFPVRHYCNEDVG